MRPWAAVPKLMGAMALLVVLLVATLLGVIALISRQPVRDLCLMCGDQSVTVRTSAQGWAPRATRHFDVALSGRLRCSIPAKAANPDHLYFPVTCAGATPAGSVVTLTGDHAGQEGGYLSGPWTLRVGTIDYQLVCLPAHWNRARPCGRHTG